MANSNLLLDSDYDSENLHTTSNGLLVLIQQMQAPPTHTTYVTLYRNLNKQIGKIDLCTYLAMNMHIPQVKLRAPNIQNHLSLC